jgi:hypothetical protein
MARECSRSAFVLGWTPGAWFSRVRANRSGVGYKSTYLTPVFPRAVFHEHAKLKLKLADWPERHSSGFQRNMHGVCPQPGSHVLLDDGRADQQPYGRVPLLPDVICKLDVCLDYVFGVVKSVQLLGHPGRDRYASAE